MPKQSSQDNIMMRPLPSSRIPWLVILVLISAMVFIYLGFLRPKDKLLGPPVPAPEYLQFVKPKAKPAPATPPAAPAPAAQPGAAQ